MELQIDALSKRYAALAALTDINLTFRSGIIGLLGPNGAGKSTLMRMLATVNRPTSGTIRWNGTDIVRSPDTLRSVLGYLPQDFGVYPHLTAVEFLEYVAALKGLNRRAAREKIDSLLATLNLDYARNRPLGGFSGGMRQRVGIAQALLNDPQLLIVDEPSAGLDPEERVRLRELLHALAATRIVIVSTHICSDIESIAHDIVIVNSGRLISSSSAPELLCDGLSLENAYLRALEIARSA